MSNLIITILAIALIAVAALMGTYYGGGAFSKAQIRANANTSITQGEQLIGAWYNYTVDHNSTWDISSLSQLSVNSYLTAIPQSPPLITNSSGPSTWALVNLSDVAGGISSNYNAVYYQLTDDYYGKNVCLYVAESIAGNSGPTSVSASTNLIDSGSTRKFDCVFVGDASADTSPTISTPKYIYYRAY